jgi:RNA polymerase sigma factor (sigma-70 family)
VSGREVRFTALARDVGPRVLAYAARRTREPADAADVLSETLLVTWRRLDAVPVDRDEALLWMLGTACRVLANQHRGRRRGDALVERLRHHLHVSVPQPDPAGLEIREAPASLPEADRELLALVAWEGLDTRAAARVLGIREAAARKRLQRRRERLRRALEGELPAVSLARGIAGAPPPAVPAREAD